MQITGKIINLYVTVLFMLGILVPNFGKIQAQQAGYNCPDIVQQAIDTVSTECTKAGRNKLCYGNSTIQADFQAGVSNPAFKAPGDTVDVAQLKQFTLGAMDTTANTWGMAELKIQAD